MRLVLATGSTDLNEQVMDYPFGGFPCEVVGECNIPAVLPDVVRELRADTVAISSSVSELQDVVSAVARLRYVGVRVIFLTGKATENKDLVLELADQGVYDFVYDPVSAGDILRRIFVPTGSRAKAERALQMQLWKEQPEARNSCHRCGNMAWYVGREGGAFCDITAQPIINPYAACLCGHWEGH